MVEVRRPPPVVGQGSEAKCWAAAMESWLRAQIAANGPQHGTFSANASEFFGMDDERQALNGYIWARNSQTMDELLDLYKDRLTQESGALKRGHALEVVAADVGMRWMYLRNAAAFDKYDLFNKMKNSGHLYISYFSYHMHHAVIAYGYTDNELLVMDPVGAGLLRPIPFTFFQESTRAAQPMFIGWAEEGKPLAKKHDADAYLPGQWHARAGNWSGYFVFADTGQRSGAVYWRTFDQSVRHQGTWKRDNLQVTWEFTDDPPGWVRTFYIFINGDGSLPDRIQGHTKTPQGATGIFTMSRADD